MSVKVQGILVSVLCIMMLWVHNVHSQIVLDGVDDVFTTPGVTIGNTFTILATIYYTGTNPSNAQIIGSSNGSIAFFYRGGSKGIRWVDPAGDSRAETTSALVAGYNQIAAVCNAGALSLYIGTVLQGSLTGTGNGLCQGGTLTHIGNNTSAPANAFNGGIGEIYIFNSAMTQQEMYSMAWVLMHFIGISRAPVAYWVFDQCAPGSNADGIAFNDVGKGVNPLTASDGGNNTGLLCKPEAMYPWGAY